MVMKKILLTLLITFLSLYINIGCMEKEASESGQIEGLPKELWAEIAAVLGMSGNLREAIRNIQNLSQTNKALHKLLEEPTIKRYLIDKVAQHFNTDIKDVEVLFGLPEAKERLDKLLNEFKEGNILDKYNIIENLIKNENFIGFKYFFKHGIGPKEMNKYINMGVLILASYLFKHDLDKRWNMLKFLIENGADINFIDDSLRRTILVHELWETMTLVLQGTHANPQTIINNIKYLIDHGADVNLIPPAQISPLKAALIWAQLDSQYTALVKLLLEKGAKVHERDLLDVDGDIPLLDLLNKYKK